MTQRITTLCDFALCERKTTCSGSTDLPRWWTRVLGPDGRNGDGEWVFCPDHSPLNALLFDGERWHTDTERAEVLARAAEDVVDHLNAATLTGDVVTSLASDLPLPITMLLDLPAYSRGRLRLTTDGSSGYRIELDQGPAPVAQPTPERPSLEPPWLAAGRLVAELREQADTEVGEGRECNQHMASLLRRAADAIEKATGNSGSS